MISCNNLIYNMYQSYLLAELYNLSSIDNRNNYRLTKSTHVALQIQAKIKYLQNPQNCEQSPKIICDLNRVGGFGCQMHHLIYCFIFSYFTNRTLILKSDFWNYNKNGYEAYFKPVGKCNFSSKWFQEDLVEWQGADLNKHKNILMPLIDFNSKRDKFWPQSLPKQLNDEIQRFHGKPFVIL